jgi:hypothetical protein
MNITTNNGLARRQVTPKLVKNAIPITVRPSRDVGDPTEPGGDQGVFIWDEDDHAVAVRSLAKLQQP